MITHQAALPEQAFESFEFRGTAREYFNIWIVNLLLTIVTLGIYSAWAKVRTLKYFYGNTFVGGHNFDYHADPRKILKGRMIAVSVLFGFGFLSSLLPGAEFWVLAAWLTLLPMLIVMATSFHLRNSSYRNIRFNFIRDYVGAYRLFGWPLLFAVTLTGLALHAPSVVHWLETSQHQGQGPAPTVKDLLLPIFSLALIPLAPYLDYARARFLVDRASYGHYQAHLNCGAWAFYKLYLVTFLFFVAIFAVLGLGVGLISTVFGIGRGGAGPLDFKAIAPFAVTAVIVFYSAAFFVGGYFRAQRTNLVYGHADFAGHRLRSELTGRSVGWLYLSNTVAAILSLGLMLPWARVRMARYVAERTALQTTGLEDVRAVDGTAGSVVGEEVMDVFDVDLGL